MKFAKLILLSFVLIAKQGFAAPINHDLQTGIGIQVGTMGGLTLYHELDNEHFVQGVLGTFWYNGFYASGDYCFQYPGAVKTAPAITPYVGVGPMMATATTWRHDRSYTAIGLHIPLGINFKIPRAPIQIFVQVGPAMLITPYTETYMDAGLGVRFLF